jgi:hypothetical protein
VQFDTGKPDWELDLLRALLQKNVTVHESFDDDNPEMPWVASIKTWRFSAIVRGQTPLDARWTLVAIAALERLEAQLRRMGWTEIDRCIDEAEFIVARDPAGRRWGIAASDGDPAAGDWLLSQIWLEGGIERAGVIDYRDIVDRDRIQMTLDAAVP